MDALRKDRRARQSAVVTMRGDASSRRGGRGARAVAVAVGAMALSGIGVGAAYGALSSADRSVQAGAPPVEARRAVVTAPVLAPQVAPVSALSVRVSGLVDESARIVAEKEERRLADERAAQEAAQRAAAQAAKQARAALYEESKGHDDGSEGCGWKDGTY